MAAKTGGNGCPGLSALSEICQQRGNLQKCQLLVVCSNIKEQQKEDTDAIALYPFII